MKSILSIALFLLCLLSVEGQNEHPKTFVYGVEGLNDFIVTPIDSVQKDTAYLKALEWIDKKYLNPGVVLKKKVEGDQLRISAVAQKILEVRKVKSNLSYTIEITFKDGRYKIELLSLRYNGKTDYKKIANFKTDEVLIKDFARTPYNIEDYFNNLNNSLRNYILDIPEKSDDW